MRNTVFGIIALTGIFACGLATAADDMRIGTVDMQVALQTVDAGKKAKAQLEKELTAKKKELQAEEDSIKKAGEEFKKQSLVLSDEARAKKQSELQERIMKFQEETGRSQMELQKKEHDLTQPIINQLRTIISDIAKKKGYTIVLEKNENTVLFSQDKDDMTTDVIGAYNKQYKAGSEQLTLMPFSVAQILELTGGSLANADELKSDARSRSRFRAPPILAGSGPEHIAFFFSREYQHELPLAKPGILITGKDFVAPLEGGQAPALGEVRGHRLRRSVFRHGGAFGEIRAWALDGCARAGHERELRSGARASDGGRGSHALSWARAWRSALRP